MELFSTKYITVLKKLERSPDFKMFLAYLHDQEFSKSALRAGDPAATHYYLGRQDLIREIFEQLSEAQRTDIKQLMEMHNE